MPSEQMPTFEMRTSVSRSGNCADKSNWKLVLKKGSGKIHAIFTIKGGASGVKWKVFIRHSGTTYSVTKTSGDGGLVVFKKTTNDDSGTDKFVAGGSADTGEDCLGKASI